ncbi:hypothetical protein F5877DRAFT_86334 [Lentinula edodes]|nr:hypothetical protein F5877DRAFT_86334 [Lentinula edodes]
MDSDSNSQDDEPMVAAEDLLDTFDPSASILGTPLRCILGTDIHIVQSPTMLHVGVAPTVRSIFPSTNSAQVLTMERRITRYFLFHGVLIIFMLAGKILSSTYNTIRMILGTDLGDVIAIVLFMACAWAISHHFLQDWKADISQISDLLFPRAQKTIGFLIVLSILSFAFATWRLSSFLDLTLDLCFWSLLLYGFSPL